MSQSIAVPAVGSKMANVRLTDPAGTTAELDALRAGERAVVFFLRASSCAICLGHAKSIVALAADGSLGDARVILVTPGDAAQAQLASSRVAGATVWASGDAHAEVGLGKFLAIQHSGTFLVAADGSVLYTKTSTLPMASFSKPGLLAAIAH